MTIPLDPVLASSPHLHHHQEFSEHGQLANLLHAVNSTTEKERTASVVPRSESSPSRKRQKNSSGGYVDGTPSKRLQTSEPNSSEADVAASALFRKAFREPSKKSTRPLSKEVFTSLKLTTEEWVRLEAEAKDYMLDETHPERQSCVGHRANSTANDTKLQLFKTVQRFLRNGAGTHFFGRTDDEEPGSKWVYPRDEDRLILLLTPLMRRMVTNERQRKYAYRTRHSDRGKSAEGGLKPGEASAEKQTSVDASLSPIPIPIASSLDLGLSIFQLVYLDGERIIHRSAYPSLSMHEMTLQNLLLVVQEQVRSFASDLVVGAAATPVTQTVEPNGTVSTEEERARRNALQQAAAAASAQVPIHFEVMAHLSDGLLTINEEDNWDFVKRQAADTPWMAGCMKLIVAIHDGG